MYHFYNLFYCTIRVQENSMVFKSMHNFLYENIFFRLILGWHIVIKFP